VKTTADMTGTTECYQFLVVQRNETIDALRERLYAYEGVAVAARVAIIAYWNFDQTTSTRHIVAMRIGDLDAKLADLDALGAGS